ncbi:MAG TPA: hypothetical protein VFA07_06755 [Chthonomonadaceae bacterium]|nr:hypothetical protein [Chthonomonadaceae bacterium]
MGLINILTFPGVVVHELARRFFCRLSRVAILDAKYFGIGDPGGYVDYEPPRTAWQLVMIEIGPFFVNTILGAIIATPGVIPLLLFGIDSGSVLDYVLVWLGASIAIHAFPTVEDAKIVKDIANAKETPALTQVLGGPLSWAIYLGSLGSLYWLDVVYGIAIVILVPQLLLMLKG